MSDMSETLTADELAAIRERDRNAIHGDEDTVDYMLCVNDRDVLLAHLDAITEAVEELPVHAIGGYEWECDECHLAWNSPCVQCGKRHVPGTDRDSKGNAVDHRALLDRAAVLSLLRAASNEGGR